MGPHAPLSSCASFCDTCILKLLHAGHFGIADNSAMVPSRVLRRLLWPPSWLKGNRDRAVADWDRYLASVV
jgi:hypothetical protein